MNSIQFECNFKPEDQQTINNSNSFSYLPFLVKNCKIYFSLICGIFPIKEILPKGRLCFVIYLKNFFQRVQILIYFFDKQTYKQKFPLNVQKQIYHLNVQSSKAFSILWYTFCTFGTIKIILGYIYKKLHIRRLAEYLICIKSHGFS